VTCPNAGNRKKLISTTKGGLYLQNPCLKNAGLYFVKFLSSLQNTPIRISPAPFSFCLKITGLKKLFYNSNINSKNQLRPACRMLIQRHFRCDNWPH